MLHAGALLSSLMEMRRFACVLVLALSACSGGQTPSSESGDDGGKMGDASSDGTQHGDDATTGDDVVIAPDAPTDVVSTDVVSTDVVSTDGGLGIDCGAPGQTCCLGEACEGNGCCVEQVCVANGQACRHGWGTCANGSCGTCGGLGQTCCAEDMSEGCSGLPDSGACFGCTQTGTMCSANQPGGTCVACGMEGQQCCFNACVGQYAYCDILLSDAGQGYDYVCSSQCGGPGQPCCQDLACKNGGCCMLTSTPLGNTCVDSATCGCTAGQCTTCGLLGQPCCPGGTCQIDQGQCLVAGDAGTCQQMHP